MGRGNSGYIRTTFHPKNLISGVGQTEMSDFWELILTANQLLGGFDFQGGAEKVEVHVHPLHPLDGRPCKYFFETIGFHFLFTSLDGNGRGAILRTYF